MEKEREAGLVSKATKAWLEMLAAGQLPLYLSLRQEEIERLKKDNGERGKSEYIAAYLQMVKEYTDREGL